MSKQGLISGSKVRLLSALFWIGSLAGFGLAQFGLEPVPSNVKYAEQAYSPVKVSIEGVRNSGTNFKTLTYKVQNLGGKPVWGVATTGLPGTANVKTFFADSLEPGHKTSVLTQLDTELTEEIVITVDAVVFLDGTVWGANATGEAEFLKGAHAARMRLISDISTELKNGEEAVRTLINREPYLPEFTQIEKKTKFEEGMARAYGAEIIGFKQDLRSRGDVGAVSARLAVLKSQMGVGGTTKNGKRIAKMLSFKDLIIIEKLEVDGRSIPRNDEFAAGDEWMRGVVLSLKNSSSKTIVSFSLDIDFPETKRTGNMMRYTISHGRRPGLLPEVKIPERPAIKPGESFQIGFSEQEFANLNRFLGERTNLGQLSRAEIGIGMIFFDDGTAWSMGNMMRADPNDPKRWIPIKADN